MSILSFALAFIICVRVFCYTWKFGFYIFSDLVKIYFQQTPCEVHSRSIGDMPLKIQRRSNLVKRSTFCVKHVGNIGWKTAQVSSKHFISIVHDYVENTEYILAFETTLFRDESCGLQDVLKTTQTTSLKYMQYYITWNGSSGIVAVFFRSNLGRHEQDWSRHFHSKDAAFLGKSFHFNR